MMDATTSNMSKPTWNIFTARRSLFKELKKFELATQFLLENQFEMPLKLYQKMRHCEEYAFNVAFNSSYCWLKLEKPEKALEEALKCITTKSSDPRGYVAAGRAVQAMGNYYKAEEYFLTALKNIEAGDLVYRIEVQKLVKNNIRQALVESFGLDTAIAFVASFLCPKLKDASGELQFEDIFLQQYLSSSSGVMDPIEVDMEKEMEGVKDYAYNEHLRRIMYRPS